MRALGVTHKGIEDIASTEVSEILSTDCKKIDSAILFDAGDMKDLCRLAYRSQTLRRLVLLLGDFEYSDIQALQEKSKGIDPGDWLKGKTFCLRCSKTAEVETSSQELERAIGGGFNDSTGSSVDLEDPDVMLYAHVTSSTVHVGVDLSGFDMAKREYNIFSVQRSLKGDISYALMRLSGMKPGDVFVDPYCQSGGIPIEAALWLTGKSPHHYSKDKFIFIKYDLGFDTEEFLDSLDSVDKHEGRIWALEITQNFLNSAKKNAKIAGVEKAISFSRQDTDWLDLKFENVNAVATVVPKDHAGSLFTLFGQFERFLVGKAVIVSDAPQLDEAASQHGFKPILSRTIYQGQTALPVKVFERPRDTNS